MLKRLVDRAASGVASSLLGRWLIGRVFPLEFHKWGEMTSLKLDSQNGVLDVTLELKGEDKPVDLRVKYHLDEQEGKTVMVVEGVEASREWLSTLIEIALKDKRAFEVPPQAAALLRGVLK